MILYDPPGISQHCFSKPVEADPLDRCSKAFGGLPNLPVERDDLPRQRHSLIRCQAIGEFPARFRRSAVLAAHDRLEPVIGAKGPEVFLTRDRCSSWDCLRRPS